ncbi:RecQ family ATP-dependent DNA helicase [Treponema sp.]|uniref:RecQ family ATP-dependent DNA helicase n=1 Tax=Treponema sp. TaxID=166 RepID=UPI0025F84F1D|nr:RecQ family ATP-dependent DNA helicase [Treponema sp.]MCR5217912.1 RecQ family ATP-dependent DNA helicase [Treponema sp.]
MEKIIFEEIKISDEEAFTDDEVVIAARNSFSISYLYPWQRIVIANIMDSAAREGFTDCRPEAEEDIKSLHGEDSGRQIVLLPTGAGKSLCFLTPALLLKGPTLVLYPLLALMTDQKRRMDEGNLSSVIFRGGQSQEEREENFRKIREGAKIILANPEVLQDKRLLERLKEVNIAHIAIDEAHCVSEWGDSFRPAYLTLGSIIKELNTRTVTAFTATASPQVLERVSQILFDGNAHIVRSCSDRPNIHYFVVNAWNKKREAFRLALTEEKPLIVFCGTRNKAEDMARELAAFYGYDKVKFYHAGMEKEEKDYVEKWFYPSKDGILCCTCAFGMGVDKKDIHTVIHLEASPTAESYIQEAGRGGRNGSIAKAILLWSYNDSIKYEKFKKGSRERILKDFAESKSCRRQVLLDALGGEEAYCDGCDVCLRGGPAPAAEDALFTFKYIKKHNFLYSRDGLLNSLTREFNKKDSPLLNVSPWHSDDVNEIIKQLESGGWIKKGKFFLKNRTGSFTKLLPY